MNVRTTRNIVEIFYDGLRICSHIKDQGNKKYITEPAHMPKDHLSSAKIEEQSYKTCNALLHLSGKYSRDRLEAACSRVMEFSPRPSYKAVESVLKAGADSLQEKKAEKKDVFKQYGFLRGADYYADGGDDDAE